MERINTSQLANLFKPDFFIFTFVTIGLWILLSIFAGRSILGHDTTDQYTLQALAWQQGKTDLNEDHPELELAYFNNRIYVSFPPVPSVIEFPFTLIFGRDTPNTLVMIIFIWLAMIFSFAIILKLTNDRVLSFFGAFVFFWGSQILYLSLAGRVWHQGQLFGVFFGIAAVFIAVYSKKSISLAFAGLMVSLAVGCRPFYLALSILIVYIASRNGISWKKAALFTFIGMAPVGILMGVYNFIRFGSFLEFGHNYLPHVVNDKINQFGVEWLPQNLFYSFVNLPSYDFSNNLVTFHGRGTAFWISSPIYVAALIYFIRSNIPLQAKIAGAISILFTWFPLLLHESNGWVQFGYRYGVDLVAILIVFFALSYKKLSIWLVSVGLLSVVINVYGVFFYNAYYDFNH